MQNARPIRHRRQTERWTHRAEILAAPSAKTYGLAGLAQRNRTLEDQLATLRREHDDLRAAMYEAAQVQRKLCGPRHVRRAAFELAREIFPVRHVSGDFISVFDLGSDLVFAIGDIAGKGLYAGMWFTHVVSMLRSQVSVSGDPAAALSAINRHLLRTSPEAPLTTLFLARLDVNSGEVTYSNAGHPPALLLRENGELEGLSEGGPLLAVVGDALYVSGRITLQPGDTLLGYSDGIAECRNPSGADFGVERIEAAARLSSAATASGVLFSVLGAAEDFAAGYPREDDMALIVLRREIERTD